jgi:serine-type D-Ala-D-Ala carboxypeptidase/endopeptidase (penicillin-binding protein 4)
MKRCVLIPKLAAILAAALLAGAASTAGAILPVPLARALKQADLPEPSVGIWVRDVAANAPVLYFHANAAFNPASTMKLVTTYAGLELLGPAYTWRTEVYAYGKVMDDVLHGDLILKGHGDPKFTLEHFWLLLRDVRQRGIREIRGDLVLDRSFFSTSPHSSGEFDGQATRPYNVGPDALLLNFHTIRVTFIPDLERKSVRVLADPKPAQVQIVNQLVLDGEACGDWREGVMEQVGNDEGLTKVAFVGRYSEVCGEQSYRLSVLAHTEYVYGVFRQLWQELGGVFSGGLRNAPLPAEAVLLTLWESAKLADIVRDINKFSNNVMARQLFLTLGAERGSGTLDSSHSAIRAWLRQKDLEFPELAIENGAGLSRIDRISAAHLGDLLVSAYRSPVMPEFMASLPLVAVDGTMKKRLPGALVAGRAHIKTGSLDGVRAIAGYVLDAKGRRVAVVCLTNHPRAENAHALEDALLEWIYERP